MDLRRRVLDAAINLIESEGLGALSFRKVARRAGVSHQAPYHHFADREAILAAIAGEGFSHLAEALEAANGPTPADGLARCGEAYVATALACPAHFRVMFRPELVPLDRHPEALAAAQRAFAALSTRVDACVDAGLVSRGEREDLLQAARSLVHGLSTLIVDGTFAASAGERVPALFSRLLARKGG